MTIYISTGGFNRIPAYKSVKKLINYGAKNIELSGGTYSSKNLTKLKLEKKKISFQIHNYFPPPKIPFVFNLASQNFLIADRSFKHVENAIKICKQIGSNYFSFHAGFLCDIKVNELGKKIVKKKLFNRKKSINIFLKRIKKLSILAKKEKITLLVENNVLTKKNFFEFKTNPLLMCEPKETLKIAKKFPPNVKLLIDVAHLKVSAKTLRFDPKTMFMKCEKYIGGYHLSDNDGKSDSNKSFSKNAWFWKYLNKNLNYLSVEVYNLNKKKFLDLKKIVLQKLNKSF
jgi:sugar phosphate isomerase/epimerase